MLGGFAADSIPQAPPFPCCGFKVGRVRACQDFENEATGVLIQYKSPPQDLCGVEKSQGPAVARSSVGRNGLVVFSQAQGLGLRAGAQHRAEGSGGQAGGGEEEGAFLGVLSLRQHVGVGV